VVIVKEQILVLHTFMVIKGVTEWLNHLWGWGGATGFWRGEIVTLYKDSEEEIWRILLAFKIEGARSG
jgi:hypothetical protein